MKLCLLTAVLIAGVSCMHRPNDDNPNCIVPLYYAPVCSENGKTYVNEEAAGCHNDKVAHKGKCEGSEEEEDNEENSEESEERPPAPRPGLGLPRPMLGGAAKGSARGRGRGTHAPNPDRPDCVVQLYYDPVCGKSGETRVNEPSLGCFDDELAHKGECVKTEAPRLPLGMHRPNPDKPECVVQFYRSPVCGASGKTHINGPTAGCFDDEVAYEGECVKTEAPRLPLGMHRPNPDKPDCVVQFYHSPVCGASGKTHINGPTAGCFDDEVAYEGECVKTEAPRLPLGMHRPNPDKPECVVPFYHSPVCGASGKTHINRPTAGCFDDEVVRDGACEDKLGGGRNKRLAGMHAPNPQRPWCVVQLYYKPVCGVSGTTHINEPSAGCFDDEVKHEGKCGEPEVIPPGMHRPNPANPNCIVQLYNKPVCAVSGKTYVNEPTAGCFYDKVRHHGECRDRNPGAIPPGMHRPNPANPDCIVQLYNKPVCAASGRTYVNRPTAGCYHERVLHDGRCK